MPSRTQVNRPVSLASASLAADDLLVSSVRITEQLGQLFRFDIVATSETHTLSFEKAIGQNITIRNRLKDGGERLWNGYISQFNESNPEERLTTYRMTIVPWLWFLGRTADFRIYQEMTVPDIIKSIFRDGGFSDFEENLHGKYEKWDYCVQYRETDLNFISRLMEQEGIYYYFKHDNGKHTLVLSDSALSHNAFPNYDKFEYRAWGPGGEESNEVVNDWVVDQRLQPGTYETMDYDFRTPTKMLKARSSDPGRHIANDYEVFDYPGEWDKDGDGEQYTKVRLEELKAQHEVVHATSNLLGAACGTTFTLSDYPREDQNKKYLITSATHSITQSDQLSGDSTGSDYSCSFTAIDARTQFRTPRSAPKPVIQGPQTAIVVGPEGEEIYTDQYGRVKVQFHWDRYGKRNDKSSCWIRVAQSWSGKKWGSMYIPRIGMEVIVNFLEGDPDLPIITGCVYNGDQMPPYELPANATRSGIKTDSSKGGGDFNEIRFEDKKGKEQLFVNASKDMDLRVKHESKEIVGASRHLIVGGDQLESVGGDQHLTVKGNQNTKITGEQSVEITLGRNEKITGGNSSSETKGMSYIKAAMLTLEAEMMLTLKVGGNYVSLGPTGITIFGTPFTLINTPGPMGQGIPAETETPKLPAEADEADPGAKIAPPPPPAPPVPKVYGSRALVLKEAAKSGAPFCAICEAAKEAAAKVAQTAAHASSSSPPPSAESKSKPKASKSAPTKTASERQPPEQAEVETHRPRQYEDPDGLLTAPDRDDEPSPPHTLYDDPNQSRDPQQSRGDPDDERNRSTEPNSSRSDQTVRAPDGTIDKGKQAADDAEKRAADAWKQIQDDKQREIDDQLQKDKDLAQRTEDYVEKRVTDAYDKGVETAERTVDEDEAMIKRNIESHERDAERIAALDPTGTLSKHVDDAERKVDSTVYEVDETIRHAKAAADNPRQAAENAIDDAKDKANETIDKAEKKLSDVKDAASGFLDTMGDVIDKGGADE